MATKYILDPSGNIIKVVPSFKILEGIESLGIPDIRTQEKLVPQTFEEKLDVDKTDYLENVNEGQNVNVSEDKIRFITGTSNLFDSDLNYIVGENKNDPSFNFKSESGESGSQQSFKPFNSFTDKPEDLNMPNVFADEFEILSGMRLRNEEYKDSAKTIGLIFTYLAESILKILTVEGIVFINRGILNLKGQQSRTAERYKLKLGQYDFTDVDIFTDYVFNVLNYPHEQSTALERLDAYFLGVSEWIAPDAVIDLNEIIKDKSNNLNFIDFLSEDKSSSGMLEGFLPLLIASSEILVASLTNTTSLNRVSLLLRKFYQERNWEQNTLYRAKNRNNALDLFTELNYYYFRFIVERIQIGLKLLNKYYYDDSYLQIRQKDSPLNRVSAVRSELQAAFTIGKDSGESYSYSWNNSKSNTENASKPGQTTRIRALPQALMANESFYRSLSLNGKATLDLSEDLLQNFAQTSERRLPSNLVKEIENHLESEYMPFYFHDLRTNELLSFHAFIENISDSFSPEYNSASGFGRIDDVKSYVKTTRNINLTFILAATSESDHDMMWYQINKIVAMVYPQWSDAFDAVKLNQSDQNADFKYPFTQVPTASPLIRLRVGDVIKSNYSRTNLSRLHGIGDREKDKDIETNPKEQNIEKINKISGALKSLRKEYNKELRKPLLERNRDKRKEFRGKIKKLELELKGYRDRDDDGKRIYYLQPGLYRTTSSSVIDAIGLGLAESNRKSIKLEKEVLIKDNFNKSNDFTVVEINEGVYKEKKISVVADISKIRVLNPDPLVKDNKGFLEKTNKIMKPEIGDDSRSNNPITRSYESGMSRGLAGFITNLDVSYNESTWETSRIGSKAPMMVKINIGFSPIHDIPPGLDHNGMLRAPVYNVGRINNEFFGDVHDGNDGHGKGFKDAKEVYNEIKKATKS